MTASIFLVQIVTDYLDRLISLFVVIRLIQVLPGRMREQVRVRG